MKTFLIISGLTAISGLIILSGGILLGGMLAKISKDYPDINDFYNEN